MRTLCVELDHFISTIVVRLQGHERQQNSPARFHDRTQREMWDLPFGSDSKQRIAYRFWYPYIPNKRV